MKLQKVCLCIALVTSVALTVSAQDASLPPGWESLSAPKFLEAIRKEQMQGNVTPELKQAIAKRSVELLFAAETTIDQLDYATLAGLYRNGQSQLTARQSDQIRQKLAARADDLTAMKFGDLSGKFALQLLAGATAEQRAAAVSGWIDAGHLEADRPIFSPQDAAWMYRALCHPHLRDGSFSVVWTGSLRAPRSGDYVFSLGPNNVNSKWRTFFLQTDWTVSIDGAQVLRATPESWANESAAVRLTGDQPVQFRAVANFKASRPVDRALHAMLYWRGPGISTSIVPSNVLTTPDGSSSGLLGEYHVTLENNKTPQTISRIDPTIDFNWTSGRIIVPQYAKQRQRLVNYYWDRFMAPEFLASCADGKAQHPFLYQPLVMAECLTTAQRQTFLKEVLERRSLLSQLDAKQATAVYTAFRFGAQEPALETLGTWMQLHADVEPEITSEFYEKNRSFYRKLTLYLVWQNPNQYRVIQDRYFEMPDGRCCLPAAYTLAYCHLVQGKIEDWNDFLEGKLKDKTMTGERRVNWLIARAQAKELLHSSSDRHETSPEEPLAGLNWLTEAHLVTQDNTTQARIYREEIARMVATNHQRNAEKLLSAVKGKVSPQEFKAWNSKSETALKAWRDRRQKDDAAALMDYQTTLSARREAAAKQSDDEAVSRYDAILQSTKPEAK